MAHVKWTKKLMFAEALKYSKRHHLSLNSRSCYERLRKLGLLDEACSHMDKPQCKYDKNYLKKEALKYNTQKELLKGNEGVYWALFNHGLMDEFGSHFTKQFTWTLDKVKEVALKYDYRSDFKDNDVNTYNWAIRNGKLKVVCSHMEVKDKTKANTVYIWEALDFEKNNDSCIIKIGISSDKRVEKRISEVAVGFATKYKIHCISQVSKPYTIEKLLHSFSKKYNMEKSKYVSGFSEFREVSYQQLSLLKTLLENFGDLERSLYDTVT